MSYAVTKPLATSKLIDMDMALLREYHEKYKKAAIKRLGEFRALRKAPERRIFSELCFCILTPQSNALAADRALVELDRKGLLADPASHSVELGNIIRGVRFWKSKRQYIIKAWERFAFEGNASIKTELLSMSKKFKSNRELRNWLRLNMRGMGVGMKEASHFLRNIGYGEGLAIIDRHVLKCLSDLDVIEGDAALRSDAHYLELEDLVADFSLEIGLPLEELDLIFWSARTGYIFK